VGKLVSKNQDAYQFLSDSIQVFPDPDVLKQSMAEAQFTDVSTKSLTFGAATILGGARV